MKKILPKDFIVLKEYFSKKIILICYLIIFLPAYASALTITTADGFGADTFVQSTYQSNNAANQNFGSLDNILVKNDTGIPGNNRKTYLKFDLNSISSAITSVDLQLTYLGTNTDPTPNPSTYLLYGLIDGHTGENWDETIITWNNAPGNNTGSTSGFLASETNYLGAFDLAVPDLIAGDLVTFSSLSLLNFLNNDTDSLLTLMITRQEANFSVESFASKENTTWDPPTLFITERDINPVPEPATMLLLGTGLAGLAGAARRRKKKQA